MAAHRSHTPKRPRWLLIGLVALVIAGVLVGCGDEEKSDESAATGTTSTSTTSTAPAKPAQTLQDARAAVNADDYATAVAIATALGAHKLDSIRRRITNRIAHRVFAALRAGVRHRARSLLIQAHAYPTTQDLTRARTSYKAAKARAAQRRQAAAMAREQRATDARKARAARRAAEQAQPESSGSGEGGGGRYAGMNCDEIGHPFSVPPGSDPEHDRNGDGKACESE